MRALVRIFLCLGVVAMVAAACLPSGKTCRQEPHTRSYFKLPVEEQVMDEILENMVRCLSEDTAIDRASRMGVSAAMQAQLVALYTGEEPDVEALRALGAELDTVMVPQGVRPPRTTFLNEAVDKHNHAWLAALLEAGADPNASGSIMAYTAAKSIYHPKPTGIQRWKDGSPAVPFLQTYLDYGGLLNTTGGGGYGNSPLINAPFKNLHARVFLLEQGADPWLTARPINDLAYSVTMAGGLISGARAIDNAEELYILAKRGLIPPPSAEVFHQEALESLINHYSYFENASGPKALHDLWRLQKVVGALVEAGVVRPNDTLQDLMAWPPVADEHGGWLLKEGQLNQAHDDGRRGTDMGTEIW
ncbi:MAG: hypothetical protein AAGL96_16270 [Pseudomonadota bacterium]